MKYNEIRERVNNGEVVIIDFIENEENMPPDTFIKRHPKLFEGWTIEDDEAAGAMFIYDKKIRAQHEYNPCK